MNTGLRFAVGVLILLSAGCDRWRDPGPILSEPARSRVAQGPAAYGGEGGRQYSPAAEITPDNVAALEPLWSYHTGELSYGSADIPSTTAFQLTPIVAEGRLYLCTPFNRVIALDPATGGELWTHDPQIDLGGNYSNQLVCRGVSYWRDATASEGAHCSSRIFTATNDARLLALDAASGRTCEDFGVQGAVDTAVGIGDILYRGEHHHTSPPLVLGDRVIIGGSVSDGSGTKAPSGVVRAYDARSGDLLWAQDLAPPSFQPEPGQASSAGYALATPNVWAPMSGDAALDLVYLPTGNPLPDYFRDPSRQMAYYGSSVVALHGASGEVAWHYQFVHRDFWDFDTPAQPTLFDLRRNGQSIPALAQATKMGFVFILDRRTGEPLFPVEERPVPQPQDFPALGSAPTQPFPLLPAPVAAEGLRPEDAWGLTFWDRSACSERIAELDYAGIYTPITDRWTLAYPGNAGGINWGGLAIDEDRQVLVVNASNLAWEARLVAREDYEAVRKANPGQGFLPQAGTPWALWRRMLMSPWGLPCSPPPWGTLTGIDLSTGEHLWQSTLGTTRDLAPVPIGLETGTPSIGGPLMTGSGLTFIGGTLDHYLRAFDNATGAQLWRARLPAPANATPMALTVTEGDGTQRQVVVVAAGGHGLASQLSDTLVAFALPRD